MTIQNKSEPSPIGVTGVVHQLLDGLHAMSKSETFVGAPYQLGDATVVPVHRLRVALGAGSTAAAVAGKVSGGAGLGAGGAVQIEPVAIVATGRDGIPRVLCVESEETAAEALFRQLPEVLGKAAKVLGERLRVRGSRGEEGSTNGPRR